MRKRLQRGKARVRLLLSDRAQIQVQVYCLSSHALNDSAFLIEQSLMQHLEVLSFEFCLILVQNYKTVFNIQDFIKHWASFFPIETTQHNI